MCFFDFALYCYTPIVVDELFCHFSSLLLLFPPCYLRLAEISAVRRVEKDCGASLNALPVSGCVFLSLVRCTQGPAGSPEQPVQLDSSGKQKKKKKKQACVSSVCIFTHGLTWYPPVFNLK